MKKNGILVSGLVDREIVAEGQIELTTFGLCDLTRLSLRVGLCLHPISVCTPQRRPNNPRCRRT
jgi:hypothetical protein